VNQTVFRILTGVSTLLAASACKQESVSLFENASTLSGSIVVSSSVLNSVMLFNPDGSFERVVRDYSFPLETPYGIGVIGGGRVVVAVEGTDRLETLDLTGAALPSNFHLSPNLSSSPIQGVVVDASGNVFVSEASTNTIEKFNSSGVRQGNPFIAATVGTCVLNTPRHIAALPGGGIAVVGSGNDRLSIYDASGGCVATVTGAPFGSNDPYGVAYDSASDKIIVAFYNNSAIVSLNPNGTGVTQIYLNTSVIQGPVSVAADGQGFLYVASLALDTVEKLSYPGGATATRVGSSPFMPPSAHLRDPTSVTWVP